MGRGKRRSLAFRILKWFLLLGLIGTLVGILGLVGLFWYFGRDLPNIQTIDDYHPKQVTRVFSADGELIDLWVDEELMYRSVVPFETIPEVMRQAMLAAEDANFYSHGGLDYPGLVRAVYANVRTGSFSQGASTITQQVVKNLILTPERSVRRKVQEVLLAFRLEERLSKDEILAIYLNEVYFGGNRYGVEEAAQYYFGKPVSEISLAEAALLAGLVQSPARYNPYRHPEQALARRTYVLGQMWEKGFIEESAYRTALEEPLELAHDANPHLDTAPWFSDQVQRILIEELGRERVLSGGLRVTTSLRLDHQEAAEVALRQALQEYDERHDRFQAERHLASETEITEFRRAHAPTGGIENGEEYDVVVLDADEDAGALRVGLGMRELPLPLRPLHRLNPEGLPLTELYARGDVLEVLAGANATLTELAEHPTAAHLHFEASAQAAFVAIDPQSREVVALVGGYDYWESPYNRATQAHRQTGSAFKPFIYGAALAHGLVTPASIVRDEPTPFPLPGGRMWNPQNSDGEYLGEITLRTALARSRNVVSVRLLAEIGLERAQQFAHQAGIESELVDNLTMALGGTGIPVLEMTNAISTFAAGGIVQDPIFITEVRDNHGRLVWQLERRPEQAMDEAVAFLVSDLMTSVVERGTARAARELGRPAAGKTGTTNHARDAWFVGFVPQLVAAAWVGYDDNRPLGHGEYGGRAALPIWLRYMQRVLEDVPVQEFEVPEGIVERLIDPDTGLLAQPGDEDAVVERFIQGTEPTRYAADGMGPTVDEVLLNPSPAGGEASTVYDDF